MPKIFLPLFKVSETFSSIGSQTGRSGYSMVRSVMLCAGKTKSVWVVFILTLLALPGFSQTAVQNDIRTKPGLTNTVWSNSTTNWEVCNNAGGCDLTVGAATGGWADIAASSVTGTAGVTIYIRRNMSSRTSAFTLDGSMEILAGATFTISNPSGSNDFVVSSTGSMTNNGTIALLNATTSGNKTTLTVNGTVNNVGTINNTNSNGVINFNTDVTNSGTINSTNTNGSELNFSGGITQTISGGTINCANVQILNASTINNNAAIIVSGVFSMDGSGNTFDADGSGSGSLTLRSTGDNSSVDGAIATLTDADLNGTPEDVVSGNVTIQRYISQNANRIYRYLSFPVSGATISQLQDDFSVTGNFTGASTTEPPSSDPTPCNQEIVSTAASLFTYATLSNEYVAYPTDADGGVNASLAPKTGYVTFIRNCETAITVDVTGQVNQGNQVFSVPFGTGAFSGSDFSLVGNPYPSPIDWGLMGPSGFDYLSSSSISTIINIPNNTSGLLTMIPLDANDGPGTGYVATGQAFWVSTASATTFTMTEDIKVAGTATSYFRKKTGKKGTKGSMIIALSDGTMTDKAYIKLNASAQSNFERNDGPKLENDLFDISTLTSDNISVVVNALDTIENESIIPLKTEDLATGSYALTFTFTDVFSEYYEVTLVDNFKDTETSVDSPYSFAVDSDAASKDVNRFHLRITRKGIVTSVEKFSASIKGFPNPVNSKYQVELPLEFRGSDSLPVLNSVGKPVGRVPLIKSENALKGEFDFSPLPSGLYVIRVLSNSHSVSLKVIKK